MTSTCTTNSPYTKRKLRIVWLPNTQLLKVQVEIDSFYQFHPFGPRSDTDWTSILTLFEFAIHHTASSDKEGRHEPQSETDPQAPGLPCNWAGCFCIKAYVPIVTRRHLPALLTLPLGTSSVSTIARFPVFTEAPFVTVVSVWSWLTLFYITVLPFVPFFTIPGAPAAHWITGGATFTSTTSVTALAKSPGAAFCCTVEALEPSGTIPTPSVGISTATS